MISREWVTEHLPHRHPNQVDAISHDARHRMRKAHTFEQMIAIVDDLIDQLETVKPTRQPPPQEDYDTLASFEPTMPGGPSN